MTRVCDSKHDGYVVRVRGSGLIPAGAPDIFAFTIVPTITIRDPSISTANRIPMSGLAMLRTSESCGWGGIGWDGWGGMGWVGMGRDGTGWDGKGWMGWDGMGRDRPGWGRAGQGGDGDGIQFGGVEFGWDG